MAQAIMDPEEVRRFAKELKRFNDDIQVKFNTLGGGNTDTSVTGKPFHTVGQRLMTFSAKYYF